MLMNCNYFCTLYIASYKLKSLFRYVVLFLELCLNYIHYHNNLITGIVIWTCFVRLANKEVVFGANNDIYSHRATLDMYSEHI